MNDPLLQHPLPGVDDPEGRQLPSNLPPVVDAHVHVFPNHYFRAVWDWFAQFGWPVRYRLYSDALIRFLFERGVRHIVALHYAHRPGVSRELNAYMAGLVSRWEAVTGLATVFPGEPEAADILREGFAAGLKGVKLHAHVQCFEMDSPAMHAIYRVCVDTGNPLVIHAGREPRSPAYPCDPYRICSSRRVERVLQAYPGLKLCVPHLGADEFDDYRRMTETYDNLWLDTTMVLADYLPLKSPPALEAFRGDRVLFGTDFPNIPYAWDRELQRLLQLGLGAARMKRLLGLNAAALYGIDI